MVHIFDTREIMVSSLIPSNSVICEIGVFKGDFSNKIFPPWDLIMSDAIDNPRPTLDLESPLLLSTL